MRSGLRAEKDIAARAREHHRRAVAEVPLVPRIAQRPLRIAMVAACPFPYPRGTPVRIHRLAEALARRGHDVHVATYHLGTECNGESFRVHRIPEVRTYRRFAPGPSVQKLVVLDTLLRRTLRRLLREYPIDVIHAHHYEGLLIARSLAVRPSKPIVFDAHTLLESELPFYKLGMGRGLLRRIGAFLDLSLPRRADHVIAVSETLRSRLLEIGAVSPLDVSVVASGVEADAFDVPPKVYPDGLPRIAFAGNLASYQGIEHLLEAFAFAGSQNAGLRLQLITDAPFDEYEPKAESLGIRDRIELVSVPFPEQAAFLRGAHVAVNPRTEGGGVPQKLMNFMAAGCPIVSFEGSAVHLRHGENAWVVRNGDTRAMGEGILRLVSDRRLSARLGGAARHEIVEHHSWDRAAREAEAVYLRLLSDAGRHTSAGPADQGRSVPAGDVV